jgi:hypothetical protein
MAIDINIESQVSQTITDGVTDKAPSENVVFDALATKANTSDIITDHSELNLDDGTNPHGTSKSDVGLSNVDNTSDLDKPISTATQSALDLKIGGAVSIGQVAFGTASGVGGDSGLFWDNTNKRLGVGTSTPTARLHVQAPGALSTDIVFRVRNSANTLDIIRAQGDGNVFVGLGAGNVNTGVNNSFFGIDAGRNNTTGANNTANGYQALRNNTTGANNTANGYQALFNNTTGANNTANGYQALFNNTTGGSNTANGFYALRNNTTGESNTANGRNALFSNINGSSNTANGLNALFANTTGGFNIANGFDAGRFISDGTTANSITNSSVFIGASTRAQANNQTNQIVIGHNAIGNGSNTVTLGNTSIIKTFLRGTINAGNLPTSATGLVAGDIWNDGGTLKIV